MISNTSQARKKFLKSNRDIERNYADHEAFVKMTLATVVRNFGYQLTLSEREDLVQQGLLTLVELYRTYDAETGIPFHAFARKRIYGGFIDHFRKDSVIPRRQQELYRSYNQLKYQSAANGEALTLEQAASYLEIDIDKLSAMLLNWEARYNSSIDDVFDSLNSDESNPYLQLEQEVDKKNLLTAISNLSEKEQIILSLYFDKEMSLKDVAEVIGVTEGRISQIKNDAIIKIRQQVV